MEAGTLRFWLGLALVLGLLEAGSTLAFLENRESGTHAARIGLPLDDAWIHMVYARSVAHSGVPEYNEGEVENGFTSPLWMLLASVAHLPGGEVSSIVLRVKVLGTACGLALSLGVASLLLALGFSTAGASLGAMLTALSPTLVFAQVSGMEVSLAAALMIWTFAAVLRGCDGWAGTLAALALLARPEMVLLLPALLVLRRLRTPHHLRNAGVRGWALLLGPSLGAALLWMGWSLAVSGHPLPNTFYAKFDPSRAADPGSLPRALFSWWTASPPAGRVITGVLGLAGLGLLFRSERRSVWCVLLAFPLVFWAAVCGSRSMPPTAMPYFYWWRYLAPALPLVLLLPCLGMEQVLRLLRGRRGQGWAAPCLGVVLLLTALPGTFRLAGVYSWNCQNIEEVQVALARWVDANAAADAVVAGNDAGALRYHGRRRTLDLIGLNRHETIEERRTGTGFEDLDASDQVDWLRRRGVDYLVVFPYWFQELAQSRLLAVVEQRRSAHLTLCEAPPPGKTGQDLMLVYRVPQ